jgi:hypothetical protein
MLNIWPRLAAGIASIALATVAVVAVAAGPAQAQCGTWGKGDTQRLSPNLIFPEYFWIKQPPGCNDFNVIWTDASHPDGLLYADYFAGWYRLPDGWWREGASGWRWMANGHHGDVPMVTSVWTGTPLTVTSVAEPDRVRVNY